MSRTLPFRTLFAYVKIKIELNRKRRAAAPQSPARAVGGRVELVAMALKGSYSTFRHRGHLGSGASPGTQQALGKRVSNERTNE